MYTGWFPFNILKLQKEVGNGEHLADGFLNNVLKESPNFSVNGTRLLTFHQIQKAKKSLPAVCDTACQFFSLELKQPEGLT